MQDNLTSSESPDNPTQEDTLIESPTNDVAPLATPEITHTLESFPTPSAPPLDDEDIFPEENSVFQYAAPYPPLQSSPPSYDNATMSPLNLPSFIQQYNLFENKRAPTPPPRTAISNFKSEEYYPAHNSAPNTRRGSRNSFRSISPFSPQQIMPCYPQIHSPLHISAPCSPKTEFSYPSHGNFLYPNEQQMPQIGFLSLIQQPSPPYPMPFQSENPPLYPESDLNSSLIRQMSLDKKNTSTIPQISNFNPSKDAKFLCYALKVN